jgi:hypothetical protein
MSTTQFIEQNQDRIRNIDGNLDDGNITLIGDDGRLEFYYFKNGELVGSKTHDPWLSGENLDTWLPGYPVTREPGDGDPVTLILGYLVTQ